MIDRDSLSRLASGELDPAAASALRAQISRDPAIAAVYDEMVAMLANLDQLDLDIPPPPGLRNAVLSPPRRSAVPYMAAVTALALAAMALLALRSPEPAALMLGPGSTWVEGDVRVAAGEVQVDLDGAAWISVSGPDAFFLEPGSTLLREPSATPSEDRMNKQTLLAAVAGATVTIAVMQGTAMVHNGDASAAVPLQAGEQHTTTGTRAARPQATGPRAAKAVGDELAGRIAELEAEREAIQAKLKELSFENALTRGQLYQHEGEASEWPEGVHEVYQPSVLEQAVRSHIEGLEGVSLAQIECAEFPCVVAIQSETMAEGWDEAIKGSLAPLMEEIGTDGSVSTNTSVFRSNDLEARYIIFGASPSEHTTPEVKIRTEHRIDTMIDELGALLGSGDE